MPAKQAIFSSMTPLRVPAGTAVITQGDADAKTFYVLEQGQCDVFVAKPEWGSQPRKVLTYQPGRWGPATCCGGHV